MTLTRCTHVVSASRYLFDWFNTRINIVIGAAYNIILVKKKFDRNGEQKEAITRVSHSQIEMDLVSMNTSESKTLILVNKLEQEGKEEEDQPEEATTTEIRVQKKSTARNTQ